MVGGGGYTVYCGRGEGGTQCTVVGGGGYTVYCGRGRGVLSVLW